jgi:hypothetical protein
MEGSCRTMQSADDSKLLLEKLRSEQSQYKEGTAKWTDIQRVINQIVAQNLLMYVNR